VSLSFSSMEIKANYIIKSCLLFGGEGAGQQTIEGLYEIGAGLGVTVCPPYDCPQQGWPESVLLVPDWTIPLNENTHH